MFSHVTIGLRPDTAMAQQPPTIVVIDDDPSIRKALDNLFRDQDLLDAVSLALERDRVRRAKEERLAELRTRFDTLTARERQVLSLVIAGRLNKQIAGELGVSEMTVKMHRLQVMRKMQASGLAQLVRLSDQLGISVPPAP